MHYVFEWDPDKARRNRKKHGVSFEQAATVFRDPRAMSLFDDEHGETEDRWITLGVSVTGGLLVVHHTFEVDDGKRTQIRIFSSRKGSAREIKHYSEEL